MNNYETIADTTVNNEILLGLTSGIFIFSAIIGLIFLISYTKLYKKAGKPWWSYLIPIYNIIVMIQIAKLPLWYILLLFIPIANIFAMFKINIEIAKKFGKSNGFGVGMTLLNIIFIPLLAFSDNKYEENENIEKNNTTNNIGFDANQVINSNNSPENNNMNNSFVENNIPTMENIKVEPVNMSNISIEENVVEPTDTPVETLTSSEIKPEISDDNINIENTVQLATNIAEDKKICKNCGNELPEIVSICPNCGTDNE